MAPINAKQLSRMLNQFGLDIIRDLIERSEGNQVVSPISLQIILSMLLLGSSNDSLTQIELNKVLHVCSQPIEKEKKLELHQAFSELVKKIEHSKGTFKLIISNLLLSNRNKSTLSEDYKEKSVNYYEAKFEEFETSEIEKLPERVNAWVDSKTEGLIREIASSDTFNEHTNVVLLNAAYFKGQWRYPFDADLTKEDIFHNLGKQADNCKVDFMNMSKDINYVDFSSLNCTAIQLPFKGRELSMVIVLPKLMNGLKELVSSLDGASFDDLVKQMHTHKVNVKLPKFSFESSPPVVEVLKRLGLKSIFNEAHLDEMFEKKTSVAVDQVIHKAKIKVDEAGVEAAAATMITMMLTSCMRPAPIEVDFIANRPFAFFIRDDENGAMIFSGCVNEL